MEVLESLAPVPSEEEAAIKPQGEGIERFRRLVEPANGTSNQSDLPAPGESKSIFSQHKNVNVGVYPFSGDGEWDSGNAATSKTKKSEIAGEDFSGSFEGSESVLQRSEKPVSQDKTVVQQTQASTTNPSTQATSFAASKEGLSSSLEPPPVPTSHVAEQRTSSPKPETVSFNSVQRQPAVSTPQVLADKTDPNQAVNTTKDSKVQSPLQQSPTTISTNHGSIPGAIPMPPAGAKQEQTETGLGETNGSGLNADELAFIAGLQKAKEQKVQKSNLPGSVGGDQDEGGDDNDSESEDLSDEETGSSASGSQQDDTISSAFDEDENGDSRSDVNHPYVQGSPEESGSTSNEEDSDEIGSGEDKNKGTILNVASGSGVTFLSGVDDIESDAGSAESSGEDDTPEDTLPGSIGEVDDIEKVEQEEAQSATATATGFTYSSGSGAFVSNRVMPAAASGSGQKIPIHNRGMLKKTPQSAKLVSKSDTKLISSAQGSGDPEPVHSILAQLADAHKSSEMSGSIDSKTSVLGSGKSETSQPTLSGNMESLADLVQLESQSKSSEDEFGSSDISGFRDFKRKTQGSGEPELSQPILPGSMGSLADMAQIEAQSQFNEDELRPAEISGSGDSKTSTLGSGEPESSQATPSTSVRNFVQLKTQSKSNGDESRFSKIFGSGDSKTSAPGSIEPESPQPTLPGSVGSLDDLVELESQSKSNEDKFKISEVSGSGDSETSTLASGEPESSQLTLPGSVGSLADLVQLESQSRADVSGSSEVSGSGDSKTSTLASGEPEFSQPTLPGSLGSLADLVELESRSSVNRSGFSEVSGSGESKPSPQRSENKIAPGESLLEQVLPSYPSGSGESYKEDETLPGSFGDQLDFKHSHKQVEYQNPIGYASGEEDVEIINPISNTEEVGSGPVNKLETRERMQTHFAVEGSSSNNDSAPSQSHSHVTTVSITYASGGSGSGSDDQQLSGSGTTESLAKLGTLTAEEESLPGSVGAIGPNLMTMASPEHKPGSGLAEIPGSGSGSGSGLLEQVGFGKELDFFESSGSGSGQVEGSGDRVVKDTVAKVEVRKSSLVNESQKDSEKERQPTAILTQQLPVGEKTSEGSGVLQHASLKVTSGAGHSDELLPGGVGNTGTADFQSLAGSGEDASGFTFQSDLGSGFDLGLSGSGSAYSDVISGSSGNSGSGSFEYEPKYFSSLSKKDFAPTTSASASASAEHGNGFGFVSGASIVRKQNHTYRPAPQRVVSVTQSTNLPASGSGSSAQYASSGSTDRMLPGSVGFEESFSSSGSAVFDTSASFDEAPGSGFVTNIAEFSPESIFNVETAASGSDTEMANVVESGAGEGSAIQTTEESSGENAEEPSARLHTGKFNLNLNSAMEADMGPEHLARVPVTLGVGSGSSYGLGSGTGIDYGSASDFFSGSAGSGTLELTPATSPSDAIVNLFSSAFGAKEKEEESSAGSSSAILSGEGSIAQHHRAGHHRHKIPISGDESTATPEKEEVGR